MQGLFKIPAQPWIAQNHKASQSWSWYHGRWGWYHGRWGITNIQGQCTKTQRLAVRAMEDSKIMPPSAVPDSETCGYK